MKWVTREKVKVDRVACPWLIQRFIDPAAELKNPIERVAVESSHPVWLIERWANAFGFAETEAFARAMQPNSRGRLRNLQPRRNLRVRAIMPVP